MLHDGSKKLRNLLGYSWFTRVGQYLSMSEMKATAKRVNLRRKTSDVNVYPAKEDTFRAFRMTSFEDTKVVILGQDPYHTIDVADGLAFSSKDPFAFPPSLENIFKEITKDIYEGDEDHIHERSLDRWANQGVLLLNTILSVEEGKALSHEKFGWQFFTTEALARLIADDEPRVFILWGLAAKATYQTALQQAGEMGTDHLILEAAHPAAESYKEDAGFFGCNHFSKANEYLKERQFTTIKW